MNKSLAHQGSAFMVIGGLQLLLDWGLFVVLSALGMPIAPANLAGCVSGALLGFWLNGRYTFAQKDHPLGWRHFGRFLVVWLPATAVSTVLMSSAQAHLGLHLSWIAKPLVQGGLAVLTFLISRHFIYR